jgi:hypothetical protein
MQALLLEDAEDFFFTHDQQLFAVDLDLGSGVFAEQNAVAGLHVQGEHLTLVVGFTLADGDYFAFLRLLLLTSPSCDLANGSPFAVLLRGKLRYFTAIRRKMVGIAKAATGGNLNARSSPLRPDSSLALKPSDC